MTITEIKKIGKGQRYYLYIDGVQRAIVEAEILAKHKLKTDDKIDEEYLTEILLENGELYAFDRALTYLEKNIKTEKGIRDYLKQKGFLPVTIDNAVAKLIEYGYINDRTYAENYLRTYAKKKGKKLLRYELITKGVDVNVIEEVFEENLDEEDEFFSCREVFRKYIKNKVLDQRMKQKSYVYLAGKGFGSGIINKVMREEACELE